MLQGPVGFCAFQPSVIVASGLFILIFLAQTLINSGPDLEKK